MENLDLTVLRAVRDWRKEGKHAMLATVVQTFGSSPRPVGCVMAMREDGLVKGSISGGCLEDDLIARYTQPGAKDPLPRTGPPRVEKYGITSEEAHRFGLPCGGSLQILLEFDPDAQSMDELMQALDAGKLVRRCLNLKDGSVRIEETDEPDELSINAEELVNTFGPEYRMLLIGAGQMSEYLASIAQICNFAVTVCDPRDEYRGDWSVPGVKVVSTMPDDTVAAFTPDARSCVIALTHDPKLDDLALLQALDTPAFYVGAIGSRRNNSQRRQRMIEYLEQTEESLKQLRGPVGIYIGSKTPAEIAVSVMAEVLAVKNGVPLGRAMDVAEVKNALGLPDGETSCFVPISNEPQLRPAKPLR
ncbi:MAG: XdhC family protein [Candidatus Cloacimonetes bacterium]|nr:XdhC family protein [Candidatus Cloacimonadota bacterium]MCK9515600.1 XdhC family protein [Ottowia sp.]